MSEDNKSPFGENTVVQGRETSVTPDESSPTPMSADKTVVFAQSNLKETFDARTVVRSSKPAPTLPDEAPVKVAEVKVPAAELPSFAGETSGGVQAESTDAVEATPKAKLSPEERRAARAALDRRTRTMIAGFAAVCVMAVLCFFFAAGSKNDKPTVADDVKPSPKSANLASETDELTPGMKKAQALSAQGSYKTTTDVLSDFDRAAKRAQDHALEYSR